MSSEGILGIKNRTENWKTARYFAPFFEDESARLQLAKRLGASDDTEEKDVQIELFWKGMRDHLHQLREGKGRNTDYFPALVSLYKDHFHDLYDKIKTFSSGDLSFNEPQGRNYNTSHKNFEIALGNNLVSTEIDIVLNAKGQLFIGEAKDEARLDGSGDLVLVHQLIRQYVMATILTGHRKCNREVVPFVVRKESDGREPLQVQFMKKKGWLPERNVLSWEEIAKLARAS